MQVGGKEVRDDDSGDAVVDVVDYEHGDGGEGGEEEFVAPADVEEVVGEAEDDYGVEGEEGGEVGC